MVKSEDTGEEKWELNGKSKDNDDDKKVARRRNDRDDDRDHRNNDRRGRGRGRGGFQVTKKCASLALSAVLITDSHAKAQQRIRGLARVQES